MPLGINKSRPRKKQNKITFINALGVVKSKIKGGKYLKVCIYKWYHKLIKGQDEIHDKEKKWRATIQLLTEKDVNGPQFA